MYNLVSVAVFDGAYDLLKESPGFILLHLAILDDIIEEFSTSIFEDHDDFEWGLDHRVSTNTLLALVLPQTPKHIDSQFDDMRMPEQLQILNLPFHPASHVPTDELLPGNYLQRHLLIGNSMDRQLDLTKGAFAQGTNDLVGADALLGLLLLRHWLIGTVAVAIWTARAGIGRFVLRTTIRRGSKRDLELAVFVGSVRHHLVAVWKVGARRIGRGTST